MTIDTRTITQRIKSRIDNFVRKEFPSEFRDHLGASIIGRKCLREIWYGFRWVKKPEYRKKDPETGEYYDNEPSMKRLFQRGHCEEDRLVSYCRGAGIEVQELDPSTNKQWRLSGVGGHFGGSCDGIAVLPSEITGGAPLRVLLEFKTYGKKAWAKLKSYGLDRAKPEHVAQMNVYGFKFGLSHSLYLPIEKDTDDIDCLAVRELDHAEGERLERKAEYIIRLQLAPARISEDSTCYDCTFCDYKKQCHEGAPASERNCRSCEHAYPFQTEGGWACNLHNFVLTKDLVRTGCPSWKSIV